MLDVIIETVNELVVEGKFSEANKLISTIDIDKLPPRVAYQLGKITYMLQMVKHTENV